MEEEWQFEPDYEEDPSESEPQAEPELGEPSKVQAAGQSPQKKRRKRNKKPRHSKCPVCGEMVFVRLRRHLEKEHLPGFLEPSHYCWTCKDIGTGVGQILHYHHPEQPGHSEESLLTDCNLKRWAGLMKALLLFFSSYFGCHSDLVALLELVIRKRWYPADKREFHITETTFLGWRVLDLLFGTPFDGEYRIAPPNRVVCLCHWNIVAMFITKLDPVQRERVRTLGEVDITLPVHHLTIDSHCHLDKLMLTCHRSENLGQVRGKVLTLGTIECSHIVCSLPFPRGWGWIPTYNSWPNVVLNVGFHPHIAYRESTLEQHFPTFSKLIKEPYCRAIGEVGLDYERHPDESERELQRKTLSRIAAQTKELDKPIVIHARLDNDPQLVYMDTIRILQEYLAPTHKVYLHCFSGNLARVQQWVSAFPNTYFGLDVKFVELAGCCADSRQVLHEIPLDKVLLETDAPLRITSPWDIQPLVDTFARYRNLAPMMVCEQARPNATRFFGL
jgi:Tat protein secretion system quality control protein TatD with DNase activity